jgi:hypothetical protein
MKLSTARCRSVKVSIYVHRNTNRNTELFNVYSQNNFGDFHIFRLRTGPFANTGRPTVENLVTPTAMRLIEKILIAAVSFCAGATASIGENLLPSHSDPNQVILSLLPQMPKQGGYSASNAATANLQAAVRVSAGRLTITPRVAVPSYCSGATYLVFVQAVEQLNGGTAIASPLAEQLAVKGQPDGVGVWGRWNANGPGTACLFRELDLGSNFTSWNSAKPGDFMKIFWNPNVGRHEHGHSAIFLGVTQDNGVEMVHFWSSNIPNGFGEKAVPKTKIASVIFSRLQNAQNIQRALYTLSPRNVYLGNLISKDSSLAEALQESGAH